MDFYALPTKFMYAFICVDVKNVRSTLLSTKWIDDAADYTSSLCVIQGFMRNCIFILIFRLTLKAGFGLVKSNR